MMKYLLKFDINTIIWFRYYLTYNIYISFQYNNDARGWVIETQYKHEGDHLHDQNLC